MKRVPIYRTTKSQDLSKVAFSWQFCIHLEDLINLYVGQNYFEIEWRNIILKVGHSFSEEERVPINRCDQKSGSMVWRVRANHVIQNWTQRTFLGASSWVRCCIETLN